MISDLERFILGLFTDGFRFVCVHISSVCVHNTYKTIIQNHKKKIFNIPWCFYTIINYYQNFKTDQPKDHKFQWTRILCWTLLSNDTSIYIKKIIIRQKKELYLY